MKAHTGIFPPSFYVLVLVKTDKLKVKKKKTLTRSDDSQKSSVPYAAPGVHWWPDSWLDKQPFGVF